jgi:2-hydroxychromene-2-carboxylate isomerase
MKTAQFWFDPICPWTYVTYQWLEEVRSVRDIEVAPRLLSLHILNLNREDAPHREAHLASLGLERFLAYIRAHHGPDAMERAYKAMAESLFVAGATADSSLVARIAADLGWDQGAAVAASKDASWDEAVRADHDVAMALVGDDVGSPVIATVGGPAFFGPVLSRAPRGEEAGVVWDGCQALASHPDFFELKRSRGAGVAIRFR